MYLFLSLKWRQSSILWSVLYRFHWLYYCCYSLSLIAICCHALSLVALLVVTLCHLLHHSLLFVVTRCHSLSLVVPLFLTRYHSLSLVVPLVVTRCHSFSLVVTRCTTLLSFYKRSPFLYWLEWNSSSLRVSLTLCLLGFSRPLLRGVRWTPNLFFHTYFNT